eukprot:NODE_97_length_21155_cov_0.234850.p13 type:complete len:172 gc:universal NODE_97_length_21155_cov_0.234850:3781-4296(+)
MWPNNPNFNQSGGYNRMPANFIPNMPQFQHPQMRPQQYQQPIQVDTRPQNTQMPQPSQKRKIDELVSQIDDKLKIDNEARHMLLSLADEFIENTVQQASQIAKMRGSTLEVGDLQAYLDKAYNMRVPSGFESRLQLKKKPTLSHNHQARVNLVKRAIVQGSRRVEYSKFNQ